MKITACFKVAADLDQMQPSDYIIDENLGIDTSFVRIMLNCFDESGLEFGLRVSDVMSEALSLSIEKSALTVGNAQADLYLNTLLALRYDRAIRIDPGEVDIRFAPEITADAIAAYLGRDPQDLIIMGRQAPLGNHAAVPQLVAARLGMPLVANVLDIEPLSDERIAVMTELDGAIIRQEIRLPAVVTIGNAEISKLRVPTLRDRMRAGKAAPICVPMSELSCRAPETKLEKLSYRDTARGGKILEETGEKAAEELFAQYLKERLEEL